MVGFATFQAYKDAVGTSGRFRTVHKVPTTQVANVPQTFWRHAGMPAAGTVPTVGLGGAVKTDKDTVGAIETINAAAGENNYLARVRVDRATATVLTPGTYILCDRLAHANVAHNQATGAFSPVIDGTDRLNAGEGAMILLEVTTALSAASNTITLTYTNQDDLGGQVTQNIVTVASSIVDRVPYADYIWVNLQAGDRGARTITNWTLVSGTGTGNITIALVRPLAWLPQILFPYPNEREFGVMKQYLEHIRNGSCLFFIQVPSNTSTAVFAGGLTIVNG